MRLSLIDDQKADHEKWIESKVIEGKINEYNMDEFEDFKLISDRTSRTVVYKARYKSTKNICALKYVGKNNQTNKELVNEDNRPSIEEVATMFEDLIVEDITEDANFDIFDSSRLKEFISNALENINFNIKLDATAFGQDEMTRFVYDLYSTFSKLFNEGKSVRDIIINYISQNNKSNEEVFQWLLENNTHPRNICLLGLFYRWNIGTDESSIDILNLFVDAANKGNEIAQYFAGRCYAEGLGTDKNKNKAIEWYTIAAKNKCAAAEHMLGEYFYKLRRYNKAFENLERATENGNYKALNTLGLCYQRGQGTNTNATKGFRLFKKAALWGLPTSQYELGNCYEYGIGTEINLDNAIEWYRKASDANSNYRVHQKRAEIKRSSNNY
ncbi:16944_t:CDS:2 [Gigaspora rosea]|nr:16944_t:CDS:2 [Gigaspora rosea]